jgi:hypothetical protein
LSAVEAATAEAAKHGGRSSEPLAALVAEAKGMIEQARAEQAERARAAAEEAAAVEAAVEAAEEAEQVQVEEQMAAITLRMQSDALQLRQMRARVGSSVAPPAAAASGGGGAMCVLCFVAPKDHIILPCYHVCVCEACASLLTQMREPSCPICRTAIQHTNKVFVPLVERPLAE